MVETASAQPSAQSRSAAVAAAGGAKRKRSSLTSSTSSTAGAASKASADANAGARPKQSKSRNGCVTCKAKRLKCDETKPTCQQCAKRNVPCGGYKKDFKWRTFEETAFLPKAPPAKQTTPLTKISSASSSSTSSSAKSPSPSTRSLSLQDPTSVNHPPPTLLDQPGLLPSGDQYLLLSHDAPLSNEELFNLQSHTFPIDPGLGQPPHPPHPPQYPATSFTTSSNFPSTQTYQYSHQIPSRPRPLSSHASVQNPDQGLGRPQYAQPPHSPNHVILRPPFEKQELEDDDPEIEEIIRSPASALALEPWPNQPNSNGFNSNLPNLPYNYAQMRQILLSQPELSASSDEMLTLRFDRSTCGIMSICDGPTENPWRTWIMPLAQRNAALYHAIAAMSSFHGSKDVVALRRCGIYHSRQSLRELALGLGKMQTEIALATTLALAFSECWDTSTSAGIDHIKGAKALVRQALGEFQRNPENIHSQELTPLRFLCKTWIYIDVLSRLTALTYDESCDFDTVSSLLATPGHIEAQIDPLMGCASTLFPIVGHVANLVRHVLATPQNTPDIVARAHALKVQLESWVAPATLYAPEDRIVTIQHSLHTAEAYRWATLLYLHQAVPELATSTTISTTTTATTETTTTSTPTPTPTRTIPAAAAAAAALAEMAQHALRSLARVPAGSRAIIVQIYPLLAAGVEARDPAARQWVRDRWAVMRSRMAISNLSRCVDVTAEVWRRRDEAAAVAAAAAAVAVTAGVGVGAAATAVAGVGAGVGVGVLGLGVEGSQQQQQQQQQPGGLAPELTVRGRLHWATVMREWKWEVLLG